MTDASRPAAGDSSGSDGTPPRAPNRHLTADEIAAGLPAGDSGAPRVNNEWVDNYAGREAEGTGRRSVERDLARDLRDCRAQLAAVTAERDEARISSAEAWNNFADADSVRHVTAMRAERDALAADVERLTAERNEANAHATACSKALTYETDEANELRAQLDALERNNDSLRLERDAIEHARIANNTYLIEQRDRLAADVKRLEEERDAKQAQLVLEILDRQEFEGRWLQAAADVKKLRAAVQLALNAFEHNWCINWDDLARVLIETEATHTERGDAHEATRDGMRLHRVPSQGGYVATGDGASVQHASSSLSMDEAACRIRDYAEQIEANERMAANSKAVEGGGSVTPTQDARVTDRAQVGELTPVGDASKGPCLSPAAPATDRSSDGTKAVQPPPSDRLRSMSLSVERTLKLESQLAALRAALAYTWPGIEEERTGVTQPGGNVSIGHAMAKAALLNARAAATARDAALREEGRGRAIAEIMHNPQTSPDSLAAMLVERGRREAVSEVQRIIATTVDIELADASTLRDRVRALLATPAPPEGKP